MPTDEDVATGIEDLAGTASDASPSSSPQKTPAKSGGWRAMLLGSSISEPVMRKSTPPLIRKKENAADRRKGILQKIEARRAEKEKLPAPLTKEETARRAALQRSPEIIAVLAFLSSKSRKHEDDAATGNAGPEDELSEDRQSDLDLTSTTTSSVSVSMTSLIRTVKDSLQNPISKEEIDLCVTLLVSTIAPAWIEIVSFGSVRGIVIKSGLKPTQNEVEERVKREVDRLERRAPA